MKWAPCTLSDTPTKETRAFDLLDDKANSIFSKELSFKSLESSLCMDRHISSKQISHFSYLMTRCPSVSAGDTILAGLWWGEWTQGWLGSKLSREYPLGVFPTEQLTFNDESRSHDKAQGTYRWAHVHNLIESSQWSTREMPTPCPLYRWISRHRGICPQLDNQWMVHKGSKQDPNWSNCRVQEPPWWHAQKVPHLGKGLPGIPES